MPKDPSTAKSSAVDDEWIERLCYMACYEGVDVRTELTKAQRWLVKKPKRRMTRAFFVNWLSKCPARPTRPASPAFEDTF